MLYAKDKKCVLFRDADKKYTPLNLYKGNKKIAGWKEQSFNATSVSQNDTYNDSAFIKIYGKSEQAVTEQGKNLFDGKYEAGTISNSDGSLVTGSGYRSKNYISLKANNSYVFSRVTNNYALAFRFYSNSFAYLGDGGLFGYDLPYLIPEDTRVFVFTPNVDMLLKISSSQLTGTELIQLELGTTATEYSPFVPNSPSPAYPSTINSVSNFDLVSCGKNLFDGNLSDGFISTDTGGNLNWGSIYKRTDFIPIPSNTDYFISRTPQVATFYAFYYDKDKTYLSWVNLLPIGTPTRRTTPPNTRFVRIAGTANIMNTITQIELGTVATPCEPFRGLQTINFPYTLRSLPDGTKDYIEIDDVAKTAKLYRNIGEYVFTGLETVSAVSVYNGINIIDVTIPTGALHSTENVVNMRCSHYTPIPWAVRNTIQVGQCYPAFDVSKVRFYCQFATNTEFKAWLSTNNVTVHYKLATPVITDLTYEDIVTYYPQTQIYTTAAVQPTLEGKIRVVDRD